MQVIKRTGEIEGFSSEKVVSAVSKAMSRTDHKDDRLGKKVVDYVKETLDSDQKHHVDEVHKTVENALMDSKAFDVAREYVTYRNKHMPDIFRERKAYKPFEYPHLAQYVDAIQQSYWIVSEYNFTGDIHDFHTELESHEKTAVERAMLAISQVEVAVKKFWGDVGNHFPKPEIEEVGATFSESECFDDQTEILTSGGWVFFEDLGWKDKVAQYDQDTGEITFTHFSRKVEKDYDGLMHLYQSRGTDVCVTPNHEILVMHPQKNEYMKRASATGVWGGNYRYPRSGWKKGGRSFTDVDKLLVAIQADGCLFGETPSGKGRRDFSFNMKKGRKVKRLEKILENIGLKYYKRDRGDGEFTVISARLPDGIPTDNIKDFGFVDLEEIGGDFAEDFIDELKYWDSTCKEGIENSFTYYNANQSAVDKIMAIAVIGEMSPYKGINRTEEETMKVLLPQGNAPRMSAQTCYALSISNTDKGVYPHRQEVQYKGKVYCVTVPKGNIVTRRNKRTAIQGNCRHARAYSHLLEVLGLNDKFEDVLEVPSIRKRVNYAQKALAKAKTDSKKDYMESVLLFTLFIENVSLFSQFLIVSQINKERAVLKGMSNVIASTSLEEGTHNDFGCDLVNTIRDENPEWFDEDLEDRVTEMVYEAFEAESEIVDWIFEDGDFEYLTREETHEYIKNRFNMGLNQAGFKNAFEIDEGKLERVSWFDVQNSATMHTDFFAKRPSNYTKFSKSFDEEDLF